MDIVYHIVLPKHIVQEETMNINGAETVNIVRILQDSTIHHMAMSDIDMTSYSAKYGFNLSTNEICNFLSHKEAWSQLKKNDFNWCLIIESNVLLDVNMKEIYESIKQLPPSWDIFIPYDHKDLYLKGKNNGKDLINTNIWERFRPEPYLTGYKLGNSIYFLSKAGALKLLEINEICDRLDHTIIKKADNLNIYFSETEWFKLDQIKDYEWPDRNKLILDAAIQQCSWTNLRLERARALLKVLSEVATKRNIDLSLDAGTLLAYVRHGGIMLWDDDFDIGIDEKNLPILFDEISKHEKLKFSGEFLFRGTRYFKLWNVDGELIDNYSYTFPFIDIWAYNIVGDDIVYQNKNRYPGAARMGLREIEFEGSLFKVPENSLEVLDSRYSDWRNTIRVYSWSHRMESSKFRYLCIPIKTDENGRIKD